MATNNSAELLIRIAADPSQAEDSIQQFRSNVGNNLNGLTGDMSQWSSQGAQSFRGMQQSMQGLSASFGTNFGNLTTFFNQSRQSATQWKSTINDAFGSATTASGALETGLLGSFRLFDTALSRNIGNANVWQKSIGQAFSKAALTSIKAIAEEAIVRALFSTALGFYLTAIGDFSGAAQAFDSAAVFGAVGGAAGLAGKALASGSAAGSSEGKKSSSSATQSSQSASGTATTSSQNASTKQQTVQIIFQGPIYGGQAGIDQLTREISRAVQERDVNLVAYTTVRQPATRA